MTSTGKVGIDPPTYLLRKLGYDVPTVQRTLHVVAPKSTGTCIYMYLTYMSPCCSLQVHSSSGFLSFLHSALFSSVRCYRVRETPCLHV